MRRILLASIAVLLPVLTVADQSRTTPNSESSSFARPSQQRLDEMRQSLVAQIAVRDAVEGAMRPPTSEEAAALGRPSGGTTTAIALPEGGVGLRTTAENLSLAVATRQPDGTMTVGHAGEIGGRHVR